VGAGDKAGPSLLPYTYPPGDTTAVSGAFRALNYAMAVQQNPGAGVVPVLASSASSTSSSASGSSGRGSLGAGVVPPSADLVAVAHGPDSLGSRGFSRGRSGPA
jgi:hypothetical protein